MSGNKPAIETSETRPDAAGGAVWIENWFRPTVTAALLTCIVVAFSGLASRIAPGWLGVHYVAFAFLVSWEGIQSERLMRRRGIGYTDRAQYRLVEAIVMLILFRLLRHLPQGWRALWADVSRWGKDASLFLDYPFLAGGIAMLLLWLIAIAITRNLYLLELHPSEISPDPTSPDYDRWISAPGQRTDRQAVLREIIRHFFSGGVILLILTGFARLDVPAIYRYQAPPLSGLVVNVMIYFALGLALISQAHFSILQASWQLRRIDVSPSLGTRWAWQAVAFLALLVALALALPTGYSVGLPQAISFLVTVIVGIFSYLGSFLLYLVSLLVGLLASLLGTQRESVAPQRPSPTQLPPLSPSAAAAGADLSWVELLKSVLFWGLFLAILGYSVYHFVRERKGLFPGFEGGLLARLLAWLRALWGRSRRWSAQVRRAVTERLIRRPDLSEPLAAWRIVRLSRLSPRQQVRYFYLSVLRRASRAGHGRRPHQTPYEYGTTLADQVPETEPDMTALTRAFVEARYSQHPLSKGEANVIKRIWQRIRALLARRRR